MSNMFGKANVWLAALAACCCLTAADCAVAQVNCNATNNPALRDSCRRQQMQIYQQQSQAYGQIDAQLGRTQRFYQGFDAGMRAGTYAIQRGTEGRVPAYNAYRAGRMIGQGGYQIWNGN